MSGLIWRCPKCNKEVNVSWIEPETPIPTAEFKLRYSDPAKIELDRLIFAHQQVHVMGQ